MIRRTFKLLALFLTALISANAIADTADIPFIYKAMGAVVVTTAVTNLAEKCKYGIENSIETDPITGISKPIKVCSPAPAGYWSDYTKRELIAILVKENELRQNMKKAGESGKSGCAAHHIVPKAHSDKSNVESRKILDDCLVGIHDAINGVYLPYKSDAECKGSRHGNLHSGDYFKAVYVTLMQGLDVRGCEGVKDGLRSLKEDLISERLGPDGYK